MGPPPTARGWGAQARALALLSSRAEQEQVVAVQKSSQADVRQAGDEGQALSEKRDSARAELQKALRGQRAALDRLRVKLERLARGDASLASHARNHASDDADDEMGLKRFDADLSRFRAGQRAEFERLRADERAVSRELAKAAARFAAWDGDDPDGVPPPPAAPGDAPPPPPPDARPEATRDVAGELRRVDARLAAGGPTGGGPPTSTQSSSRPGRRRRRASAPRPTPPPSPPPPPPRTRPRARAAADRRRGRGARAVAPASRGAARPPEAPGRRLARRPRRRRRRGCGLCGINQWLRLSLRRPSCTSTPSSRRNPRGRRCVGRLKYDFHTGRGRGGRREGRSRGGRTRRGRRARRRRRAPPRRRARARARAWRAAKARRADEDRAARARGF